MYRTRIRVQKTSSAIAAAPARNATPIQSVGSRYVETRAAASGAILGVGNTNASSAAARLVQAEATSVAQNPNTGIKAKPARATPTTAPAVLTA